MKKTFYWLKIVCIFLNIFLPQWYILSKDTEIFEYLSYAKICQGHKYALILHMTSAFDDFPIGALFSS